MFSIVLGVKKWHKRGCHVKVFSSPPSFFEYLRDNLGGNLNYNLKLGQMIIGL